MKIKNNKGFAAIDATLAIIGIMIFSVLIFTLMHNNFMENLKVRMDTLATIYLTETLENVGITAYADLTNEKLKKGEIELIPEDIQADKYNITIDIIDVSKFEDEKIIKKVIATISYELGDRKYQYTMERIKIKE